MRSTRGRHSGRLAWILGILATCCAGSAHAQFGLWGLGGGPYAIGGGPTSFETVNAINQRSLAAGQAAFAARSGGGGGGYGGNSNAYYLHARDDNFFQTFDVSTRRGVGGGGSARVSVPKGPPIRPLAQFFNAMGALVWPSNAPVQGILQDKRAATDQASAVVLQQVQTRGVASVATATDARTKLLAYGHPAIDYLNQHTSQAVADSFEDFLLSLYDSLGDAAVPPAPEPL